jgi:hypothetical protein
MKKACKQKQTGIQQNVIKENVRNRLDEARMNKNAGKTPGIHAKAHRKTGESKRGLRRQAATKCRETQVGK